VKHYSPTSGSRRLDLATEESLRAAVRAQLGAGLAAKAVLAVQLGISEATLSKILRGGPIGEGIAEKLGYRRVTRFERIG
jgi:hypothetical protein